MSHILTHNVVATAATWNAQETHGNDSCMHLGAYACKFAAAPAHPMVKQKQRTAAPFCSADLNNC